MRQLVADGSVRAFEAQQRRASGELCDVLASLEVIELAGQTEPVLISMFTDITERKQAERGLRESEERFPPTGREHPGGVLDDRPHSESSAVTSVPPTRVFGGVAARVFTRRPEHGSMPSTLRIASACWMRRAPIRSSEPMTSSTV